MTRRFLVAWAVLFVLWMLGSFVVHGLLLGSEYARLTTLFRQPPEANAYFPWMILAHVSLAGGMAWIYQRGSERKPWPGQGARFGLAIAAMTALPTYLIYYAVQPTPGALVAKQIVFDGALIVLLGMAAAWLLRNDA